MNITHIETVDCSAPPCVSDLLPHPTLAQAEAGDFQLQRFRLNDGQRAGVELLVVNSGSVRAAICPTRGMSLWKAHIEGLDYAWHSPVPGPVHPQYVALDEPNGIGWLDGFDELLVRCGMRSCGAPDFDSAQRLAFPLHGRVGNLPAQDLRVRLDQKRSQLHVTADVYETRFLQYSLRLRVQYTFTIGKPVIEIHDQVTNLGGSATSIQMLYHINLGRPLLAAGAKLDISAKQAVARDARAAEDLQGALSYLAPTAGYSEQVYFSAPAACADGWAKALLTSADQKHGFAVHYKPETLPYFSQWKNTVAEADGYVTGLEPATGFPNPRSFEESQGRTVELAAGESREFQLQLEGICQPKRLAQLQQELLSARDGQPIALQAVRPDWCQSG